MNQALLNERILASPKYQRLVKNRTAFLWRLSFFVLIAYLACLALLVSGRGVFALRATHGAIIPSLFSGVMFIVFAILMTWIYARRAKREFDVLLAELTQELKNAPKL
ncbi:MAG: DUF485 domain-containing protein [Zoogloeaceae bacterium]|jgi:uncharacterized membrane protein (DUF485 family)|nr:DUF485 domain-containing protein [Zoogloeaceae bacterium]